MANIINANDIIHTDEFINSNEIISYFASSGPGSKIRYLTIGNISFCTWALSTSIGFSLVASNVGLWFDIWAWYILAGSDFSLRGLVSESCPWDDTRRETSLGLYSNVHSSGIRALGFLGTSRGKLDLTNRLEANIFGEVEVSDGDRARFFESKVENQDVGEFRMLVFEMEIGPSSL
ncbi:hypothetical protein C2G38_2199195 [Gigaspora rosea]|uniref:Uncharacterized protein n=1 Tax=Gigaspora rosea TaxID=44941 RepID=A0A397UUX2_9GLOM|nr:hypothetical protein C2G38_2199195 [Gigaspora rosea]